jgi:DNA repair exonuclease SbcCD ATPase subunit
MAATGTFSDWLELLGLDERFANLLAGRERFAAVRAAIADARDTYPGVSQDYVSVLDLASTFVDDVEDLADQQREAVDEFNASVMAQGYSFSYDAGRLLSEDDRDQMHAIAEAIEADLDDLMAEMEDLQNEIEALNSEIEDLQESSAFDDLEAAESELEDAEAELQEAAEALEAYQ